MSQIREFTKVSFKSSLTRSSNLESLALNSEYGKWRSVNVDSSIRLLILQCISVRLETRRKLEFEKETESTSRTHSSSCSSRNFRLELGDPLRKAISISSRRFWESP
jgi:hypothetical protein